MTKGPYVGAHVSASGGLSNAILNAVKIDAESIQIFPGAPQVWKPASHTDDEIEKFKNLREQNDIKEIWLHNIYLANMAADNSEQLDKSIDSVVHALNLSSKINGAGVVLHTGSHKGKGFNKVSPLSVSET